MTLQQWTALHVVLAPLWRGYEGSVVGDDGCWIWRGRYSGRLPKPRAYRAMRRSLFVQAFGRPAGKLWLCCACDNDGSCINPEHMRATQPADRVRSARPTLRADHKARITLAKRAQAKLDAEQVRQIRALRAAGKRQADVAAAFGIAVRTVYRIERQTLWRDATAAALGGGA